MFADVFKKNKFIFRGPNIEPPHTYFMSPKKDILAYQTLFSAHYSNTIVQPTIIYVMNKFRTTYTLRYQYTRISQTPLPGGISVGEI